MLREAITSDVPSIRTLMQTVPGLWQPSWSERTIAEAIGSAHGLAFVWEQGAQILGFACAHDLGFRAYLSELVVDIRVRRQGIGTRLMQAIEEYLRSSGQQILIADVWRDAEHFYKSLGWGAPDAILLRQRLAVKDGGAVRGCSG